MLTTFCLALAIYVEARGEPIDGQLLVAEVVINRTKTDGYPDEVCAVVFDPDQFSGITEDVDFEAMFVDPAWVMSQNVATAALEGHLMGVDATHYHTPDVDPYWADSMILLGQYGDHIFYREEQDE